MLVILLANLLSHIPQCQAANVRFWLSNADSGPQSPTIEVLPDVLTKIDVWARPTAGFTLTAFSLNLVADAPGAVNFQNVYVHNPLLDSPTDTYRHQIVFDSTVEVESPNGPLGINIEPELIEGFSGLSFYNLADDLPSGGGIGPTCMDELCSTASGNPSWKIATVEFQTGDVGDMTNLYLEIGTQGIWQIDEDPTDTSAIFGTGVLLQELHGWSTDPDEVGKCNPGADCRNQHKGTPDAVIQVVESIADADFDDDTDVDGYDFLTWQRHHSIGMTHAVGDANGDGSVNDLDLEIWSSRFGTANALSGVSVPEPATLTLLVVLALGSCLCRQGICKTA